MLIQNKGALSSRSTDRDVVLFSGGIDSATTAAQLKADGKNPLLLFIETGAKDIDISRAVSKKLADRLGLEMIIDNTLKEYGNRTNIGEELYIPRRNVFFALIAATYGNKIYLGGIKGDFTNDKSPQVMSKIKELANLTGNKKEQIEFLDSILWDKDKVAVAKTLLDLGYEDIIRETVSCYSGKESHCGDCQACMRKYAMMAAINISSDGVFDIDPLSGTGALYYKEMIEEGVYSENIPENIMRRVLGFAPIKGGDEVSSFEEAEKIKERLER